ncbi:orotidine-5'-phosphate decarboxylase [Austwickia chelonae]|nr:orotidine-5'-phosphate decarboxylase [Austwickia chelonae]SEW15684.1 orotidine-5'-phosphate decarboxylase [Austwickia chelonae]
MAGSESSFGARLRASMDRYGPLCVGIDPHPALLDSWGLADDPAGLESFAMTCVEAFSGAVACVKPQSAFFERHGSAGIAVLEKVLAELRGGDTLSVLDVKRGDIGSTMAGYAQAYLTDGPLGADAITVSPYLGYGSLRPALDAARDAGRGVFVLALTSNPEGPGVQHARAWDAQPEESGAVSATSVAGSVVSGAAADNAEAGRRGVLGHVGLVIGATVGDALQELGVDLAAANAPVLAPGIGAQGADADDLRRVFGAAVGNVLPSSSREILSVGPQIETLRERARLSAEQLAHVLEL